MREEMVELVLVRSLVEGEDASRSHLVLFQGQWLARVFNAKCTSTAAAGVRKGVTACVRIVEDIGGENKIPLTVPPKAYNM